MGTFQAVLFLLAGFAFGLSIGHMMGYRFGITACLEMIQGVVTGVVRFGTKVEEADESS